MSQKTYIHTQLIHSPTYEIFMQAYRDFYLRRKAK